MNNLNQKDTEHSILELFVGIPLFMVVEFLVDSTAYVIGKVIKDKTIKPKDKVKFKKDMEFIKSLKGKKNLTEKEKSKVKSIIKNNPKLKGILKDKMTKDKKFSNMEQNETNYSNKSPYYNESGWGPAPFIQYNPLIPALIRIPLAGVIGYIKHARAKKKHLNKHKEVKSHLEFLESIKGKKNLSEEEKVKVVSIIKEYPKLESILKEKDKKFSNMEQNETNYSATKAVKVKMPTKTAGSPALTKVRKWKRVLVYLQAKKDVAQGKSGLAQWSSGEEAKLKKVKSKYEKARKQAAPELIKLNMAKRAARGRGKKRGSTLAKLGTKK